VSIPKMRYDGEVPPDQEGRSDRQEWIDPAVGDGRNSDRARDLLVRALAGLIASTSQDDNVAHLGASLGAAHDRAADLLGHIAHWIMAQVTIAGCCG
jgi:hypothetical protein